MLTTDKALDMLPHVVDLYDKLQLDQYRKDLQASLPEGRTDKIEVGIKVFKYLVKNLGKAKTELYEVMAIAQDKTIEEIKTQSIAKTIKAFKDLFADKELVDFFKQAMQ